MNNYQTGVAANVNVLLTALDTWLVSTVGYTQNLTPTVLGNGYRAHYQITTANGNTLYLNLRTWRKDAWDDVVSARDQDYVSAQSVDGICLQLSKAYVGTGNAWDQQGGHVQSGDAYYDGISVHAGSYDAISNYHFFHLTDPHMICVVLEWQLGQFTCICWGEPENSGAGSFSPNNGYFFWGTSGSFIPWNLGTNPNTPPDSDDFYQAVMGPWCSDSWYQSSYWSNLFHHAVFFQLDPTLHNGANGWLGPFRRSFSSRNSTCSADVADKYSGIYTGVYNYVDNYIDFRVPQLQPEFDYYSPLRRSANEGAGVTVFLPFNFWWQKNSHDFVYLGSCPEIYFVNMRDLVPGETIIMGSDQYIAFPFGKKPNPFDYEYDPGRADKNFGVGMVIKKN